MTECPICEDSNFREIVSLRNTPVNIGALYRDPTGARNAPRGDIELCICEDCGLIRNLAFDPDLVKYDCDYENSQMFSPTFRRFAQDLAHDLVARYDLRGRPVVEVGCGKGEFLQLLCDAGVGLGIGYDPTYDGEVEGNRNIQIHRQFLNAADDVQAGLVVSRHVVEHLADPVEMLQLWHRSLQAQSTPVYVEVPNARFVFGGEGHWDIIYPHVNYFCDLTMRKLLAKAGFTAQLMESVFFDQFLAAHGLPGRSAAAEEDFDGGRLSEWIDQVEVFRDDFRASIDHWTRVLDSKARQGSIVLWGAGAKGLAFLNFLGLDDAVSAAVDVNPRKHGAFLPGTGHEVVPPEALQRMKPSTVLITNAKYEAEIRSNLAALEIDCETICI